MKEKNKTCGCACHSKCFNRNFEKELEHSSKCCPEMNGYIPDTCEHNFVLTQLVFESEPMTTGMFRKEVGYACCQKCGEVRKKEVKGSEF